MFMASYRWDCNLLVYQLLSPFGEKNDLLKIFASQRLRVLTIECYHFDLVSFLLALASGVNRLVSQTWGKGLGTFENFPRTTIIKRADRNAKTSGHSVSEQRSCVIALCLESLSASI